MPVIDFRRYITQLQNMGFLDVVLPFLLFFTIVFAALQKTKILGDKDATTTGAKSGKRFNVVVALVIALLVIMPHVIYQGTPHDGKLSIGIGGKQFPDPVDIVNNSLPTISVWIIAILMLMLILGLFGGDLTVMQYPLSNFVAIGAVVIVGYVFGAAAGWWGGSAQRLANYLGLNDPNTAFGLILLLVFGVVLYFIVREPEDNAPAAQDKPLNQAIQRLFNH